MALSPEKKDAHKDSEQTQNVQAKDYRELNCIDSICVCVCITFLCIPS